MASEKIAECLSVGGNTVMCVKDCVESIVKTKPFSRKGKKGSVGIGFGDLFIILIC